jgi:hypothetical protein
LDAGDFVGFCLRHQRIGTRQQLTCSRLQSPASAGLFIGLSEENEVGVQNNENDDAQGTESTVAGLVATVVDKKREPASPGATEDEKTAEGQKPGK